MIKNRIFNYMLGKMHHYNHESYWKMREDVVNKNSKKCMITKLIYLYKIKKSDAYNNASMGTHLGYGALFLSPPKLPHFTYGIIISHNSKIGKNCTIFHQVTIGEKEDNNEAPVIGDNVIIGAGAKIIGNVHVGDNCKIGANAVVTKDVPNNKTVIGFNKII